MKKLLMGILLLLFSTLVMAKDIDINKAKGTEQDVIVQLTPSPAQEDVSHNIKIEAFFTIPLDAKHVKKHDIKLKCLSHKKKDKDKKKCKKEIKGETTYVEDEKKVTFTPKESLTPGVYEVEFKSLKAHKDTKIKEIKYRFIVSDEVADTIVPKIILNGGSEVTLFQGNAYEELGTKATDESDGDVDVTVSGSVDTSIEGTYTITYTATDKAGNEATATRTVNVVALILESIGLESNVTLLNVGEQATLTIIGTYSDNSTKVLDINIEWLITPSDSVQLSANILTAKKNAKVSVQARIDTVLSNTINLTIAAIINGYVLPPEPDPSVNNTTLLGIDSNDNGVRDDVERWIYITYKDKHPIHVDVAMQAGKAWQKVLEDPSKAKEIHHIISGASSCEAYFAVCVKDSEKSKYNIGRISSSDIFIRAIFNTSERWDAYIQYDALLSGGTYSIPRCSKKKDLCNFDTSKYEE